MPDPIILPTIFNDDNNVDALETIKLEKLVLLNILVLVMFKLSIFNLLNVDIEFILPNKLVLVIFKLSIFNLLKVDKLLKFVLYAYKFIPNGVDVIDVIVPCTELSELKITVAIL